MSTLHSGRERAGRVSNTQIQDQCRDTISMSWAERRWRFFEPRGSHLTDNRESNSFKEGVMGILRDRIIDAS